MFSILATILLGIAAIVTVLIICGLPLGEFTMGGKYKVLPPKMRIIGIISIALQLFGIFIILQADGYMGMWFSFTATRVICYVFMGYFFLNTLMNAFSESKKEKYTMTPLSIIAAICFMIVAITM